MVFGWPLLLEILNKQPFCTLTCVCSTTVRGGEEVAQTLAPYLRRLDIRYIFGLGVRQWDTSIHFYCSTECLERSGHCQPRPPGPLQSTTHAARYQRWRGEDREDTHIHAHARQTLQMHTHTGDIFGRDRPDVLSHSVCVSTFRSLCRRSVNLWSSARRHGRCDGDQSDRLHHTDHGGSRLYVI